jgi:hypothetical protein
MRAAGVAVLAALTSFQVIRTAAVEDRQAHPSLAGAVWPSHPAVLTDQALLSIATVAARARPVPETTRASVRRIAVKSPLSPDPFLIEGAIAEYEGRADTAERLLLAARNRDPRSRGTRYLLAERFFRTGRITAGLLEMQALVSLQSRGAEAFIPALVGYARTPGAVPALKAYFVKFPRVESSVLTLLATDAANADLVLALANVSKPDPDWRGRLVTALASDGQYARAYSTWARLSGVRMQPGLFNPDFSDVAAPPPFNWAFPETGEGLAEPDGKGGIDVLYYGRAKALLASQLLLLNSGQYRLAMDVAGPGGDEGAIHWIMRCEGAERILVDLPLRAGTAAASFAVPAGCDAQWLELRGIPGDLSRTIEFKVHDLHLAAGTG